MGKRDPQRQGMDPYWLSSELPEKAGVGSHLKPVTPRSRSLGADVAGIPWREGGKALSSLRSLLIVSEK